MKTTWRISLLISLVSLTTITGCSLFGGDSVRSQNPDIVRNDRLIGDLAVPYGMWPVRIEAIGLVNGLENTGSDPGPGPLRARLMGEMQTRQAPSPNLMLSSPKTSLVKIQSILPPGIQKGDRVDVEVRIPSKSKTTSLRSGFLMETRLSEMAILGDNQFHEGHVLGLAKGPVLTYGDATSTDRVSLGRGRILGGGVALQSRPLRLVLREKMQTCANSSRVADTINKRFHTFIKGSQAGMASAKTNEYIELNLHPRYKDNVHRFVAVVRALALDDSARTTARRIEELRQKLHVPDTASGAAIQLEAIGSDAAETLIEGTKSTNPEIRFYSAEALAYLDRTEAAEPLAEIALTEPAFRVFALQALSAMDDGTSASKLYELLSSPSVETRYGAFRALWAMNPYESHEIRGEKLGKKAKLFYYHKLNVNGAPLIHARRSQRPELVMFGLNQKFTQPVRLRAGKILITSILNGRDAGMIGIAKFEIGQPDERRVVSASIDEVIRKVVELEGSYPDVVHMLQQAQEAGALPGRLEIDALPEAGRVYRAKIATSESNDEELTAVDISEQKSALDGLEESQQELERSWISSLTGWMK